MRTHKDVGRAAVPISDGYIQCILCECGAFVRPHEWREHIGAAVESLSAKRDAEAAVIEAARAWATNQRGWLKPLDEALAEAVDALRALEVGA
jgi:hypothetical protein